MRIIKLFGLAKGFLVLFMVAAFLTAFHQWTYSNVPLFTQYLIKALLAQPGIAPGSVSVGEVNLPSFLIAYFEKSSVFIEVVFRIALSLMVLQIFRFTLRFFEMWLKGSIQERMAEKMRINLYGHIQDLNYEFHNNADSGDLIQRVTTDVEATTGFLTGRMLDVVHLSATLFFGAYQLIRINPTMVWITLAIVPLVAVSSTIYFVKIDKIFKNIEETESKMMTVVQENLSGARVVRAFANEVFEIEKMDTKNREYADALKKANKIVAVYWGAMDFVGISQYLVIIAIGVYAVQRGTMDASGVVASLSLVGMLIWPVRGLGRIINDFGKALVASDRINEILDKPSEYENDGTQKPEVQGSIEFRDVSFKFSDTNDHLLKKVSFNIKAGQTVAIIGRTGSGKSTIINLLLRMYEYDQGDILIDGISLKDISKKHIRNQIGVVLQDPFLYSKTVFENIAIAQKNAQRERVYRAAETAALAKDIRTFKQGYETIVGEKGTTLSGGQKQRVAIARVLVSDKPILIFDDALSAVDNKTDMMIREALLNKDYKHTTVIITHRITTAKEADQIIVLDQGHIEAIGTHEALSKQEGLYKKLWDIQGKLEKEFQALLKAGEDDAT
ncbi:ABC transporter ATP-binding protein [Peloplasma aerotolerans]|uniref:ABC transporter ATP-binding protein n=1 Tax=Peloplasma aerotolerans TaxID=3044389 RepID=A0AAW6U980_9MOLU|nr:ABC transporter ATP-binding protein [Mariniplasma sp. M4Ah]MDI6452688.1 ABC transporter ATP-binding protein [Mariniplasma sp. M4Ah]